MRRFVVWFSCGAPSAVAAYLATRQFSNVRVVYCNTSASEHPDNVRFKADVEKWIGQDIEVISSEKYSSVDEVFERERYMSGVSGARCTTEMKKIPRFEFQQPGDIHIFGLAANESDRIAQFEANNPELRCDWILRREDMTEGRCHEMVEQAGIPLPVMYSLGFRHNNCIACVKATSPEYWQRTRAFFPEVFERRAKQSRAIGCRLVRMLGERIFLDELPESTPMLPIWEDISCGPQCDNKPEQEVSRD